MLEGKPASVASAKARRSARRPSGSTVLNRLASQTSASRKCAHGSSRPIADPKQAWKPDGVLQPVHVNGRRALVVAVSAALGLLVEPCDAFPAWETAYTIAPRGDPSRCNERVAAGTTLDNLIRHARSWVGKCVSVQGFVIGLSLSPQAGRTDSGLGLYLPASLRRLTASRSPREITVTGALGDCLPLSTSGALPLGYCHYHRQGPYLAVTAVGPPAANP